MYRTEEQKMEDYRAVYDGLKSPPQTAQELYKFLVALVEEPITFQPCCDGHVTPWHYIWESYKTDLPKWRGKVKPNLVYLGPRGGYKTLSVARLITAESLLKPNCITVGLGAIENHSTVTYRYCQRYLNHPVIVAAGLVEKLLMKETVLTNGSKYVQTTATIAGVNSIHCQKLRTEENDIMSPQILEEAKMMVTSFGDLKTHTSYVSSRKADDGVMDNLVEHAEARDAQVLTSCYKDTSEPCPVERRGEKEKEYAVEDIFNSGEQVIAKAFENCGSCDLLPSCRGDLARANGIVQIDDHIKDWRSLDRDTWIFQKECRKTKGSGVFFIDFSEELQVGSYPYQSGLGPVDLTFDFSGGGDDPTVCQYWQTHEDRDYCIGEQVFHKKLASDVAREVREWLADRGVQSVRHIFGDSAAQQWMQELKSQDSFFRFKSVKKIHRRDGWGVVKRRIRDMNGVRRILVDKSCRLFITELKQAKKSKVDPLDIKPGQSDHALDACRYRKVELYHHHIAEPNIRILNYGASKQGQVESESDGSKKGEKLSINEFLARYYTSDDD